MKKNNKGFTLIELIVVLVIVGILAAIAVPQYLGFAEKARAAEAIGVISAIKTGEETYYAGSSMGGYWSSGGSLASGTTIPQLGISIPMSTMWTYSVRAVGSGCTITATRGSGGSGNIMLGTSTGGASAGWLWSGTHTGTPQAAALQN